jgi:hypothetical protein
MQTGEVRRNCYRHSPIIPSPRNSRGAASKIQQPAWCRGIDQVVPLLVTKFPAEAPMGGDAVNSKIRFYEVALLLLAAASLVAMVLMAVAV